MSLNTLGKILIVDSDENISALLCVNFRSEGYDVVAVPNADMAKDVDLSDVVLIIADQMDEPYSGISLLKDLKRSPAARHIGFIICSIIDSERLIIEALDAGADDYIVKPFFLREIVARSRSVIRRHSRRNIIPAPRRYDSPEV